MRYQAILRRLSPLLLAASTTLLTAAGEAAWAGVWSVEATLLPVPIDHQSIRVVAPDKSRVAIVEDVALKVEAGGKLLGGLENVGLYRPAELIWSPDSRAFAVTQTDGGAVGTWSVTVFLIEKERVRHMIVSKEIVSRAMKRFTGRPWLSRSAARNDRQLVPHSSSGTGPALPRRSRVQQILPCPWLRLGPPPDIRRWWALCCSEVRRSKGSTRSRSRQLSSTTT